MNQSIARAGFFKRIVIAWRPPSQTENEASPRKLSVPLFKTIVFALCSTGMIYQASHAITNHLDYPSFVSSTFEKDAVLFPAVTVCPEHWFNLTNICRYYPGKCTRQDVMYIYSMPKVSSFAEWRLYGQPIIENFFKCQMLSRAEQCPSFDCTKSIRRAYYKTPARFCFVFDVEKLGKGHPFHSCQAPWFYELQITVTWNETYMLSFLGTKTIPVYVHRAGTNPPISIEAINMFPDRLIEASAVQQTINRLPYPFRTKCYPYGKVKPNPKWGGRPTIEGCVQDCRMAIEQELCNCTMPGNEYSGAYVGRLCLFKDFKLCEDAAIANGTSQICQRRCQLPCQNVLYDVKLAGLQRIEAPAEHVHQAELSLSMASSSVETFTYGQAIEAEVTFGYVSGYIGVWIGISFVSLAEKFFLRSALLRESDQ